MIQYPLAYNPIIDYYNKIEAGEFKVSKKVRATYKEMVRRINDPDYPYKYSPSHANHAIEFVENFCKHSKGKMAGKPFLMELWQHAMTAVIFGFVDKETELRMVREAMLLIGRKNGKSPFASALGLYGQIADGEGGAEIVSASTKRDQAKIVWEESKRMVQKSPELSKRIKVRTNELIYGDNVYKPLASDSNSLDGLNLHMALLDELHAWKDINLYDVIVDAMSAREQPLTIITTTAGTVRNSIYDQKYEEYTRIVQGYEDNQYRNDRRVCFFYELDSEEEIHDESNWVKANPMLGVIKKYEDLREKYQLALVQPTKMKNLLCKDFNLMQNGAQAWLTHEQLFNDRKFNLLEMKPRYAIGGVDLSRTTDLTSACAMFKVPGDNNIYVESMYWLPADNLELREEEDGAPYTLWAKNGLLRLCEGNEINLEDVTEWYKELERDYGIYFYKIGYDDYSARYWVREMEDYFGKGILQKVSQGYRTLSLPMQAMGKAFERHEIIYNYNPITLWCLTNTSITIDDNLNIKPVKGKGRMGRIDGVASMLDAYVMYYDNQTEYENLI